MVRNSRFNWMGVGLAVIAAEALPILLLIVIVLVYGLIRRPDSPSPEEFAPRAGLWVGPLGGFFATLLCAWWAARRAPQRPLVHGVAVGVATALLDFAIGLMLGGVGAIQLVFFLSNGGRILAGVVGGWLGARRSP